MDKAVEGPDTEPSDQSGRRPSERRHGRALAIVQWSAAQQIADRRFVIAKRFVETSLFGSPPQETELWGGDSADAEPELRWGMKVTLGDVFVGTAAIAGGTGLLLSYRSSMAARRKLDIVAELTRRKISGASPQRPSDENPNVGEKPR